MSINLANAVYLLIVLTPQPKTMLRLDLLDRLFCMNTCTFFLFSFSSCMSSGSCICVCNSTSCQVHFIEVEMPPPLTAMPGQDVLLLVSSFCVYANSLFLF